MRWLTEIVSKANARRGDRVEDPVVEECSGKLMGLVQAGIVDSDSSYRRWSDLVRDVV